MQFPTLPTVLQTTSLLTSTSLLALSAVTIYLTTDYTTSLNSRVPAGPHTWFGLINSPERSVYWAAVDSGSKDFDRIELEYATSNDIWVLANGCVGLVAGLMAWLAVWWTSKKEKNPTASCSRSPWVLVSSTFFSTAVIVMSFTSTIITSQTKSRLQGSTCIPHSIYTPTNNYFVCTLVGGGLSGLVVANRLTENANISVLIIENGVIDDRSTTSPLRSSSPSLQHDVRCQCVRRRPSQIIDTQLPV
ncbi:uncharacterized protein ALTATR162_LOCUS912 [Alternaria atra]|uniref:Glucose-methanol-choline oxidoreductase N-terminal domain-containing protein n=1 Tax=Alternaria atra TaxID=119953 RepID=A0A8J2MWM3_9PLEO|nr:uncharacterized protein ALTATR162_LOCUS912 [Alternaria atra]CAG5141328.1 unnamed protein product [Alternaria atra]